MRKTRRILQTLILISGLAILFAVTEVGAQGYRYLFNTSGEYVAFELAGYVFDPDAHWIGFIRNEDEVYSMQGTFLGYLMNDDRVARRPDGPALLASGSSLAFTPKVSYGGRSSVG